MMSDFSLLRLEHNGDEARDILGAGSEQLKKIKYYLKNYPVDAVLMSAGGNDLVAGELAKVLNKKVDGATWQSAIKLATLTTVLDDIVAAYTRLLDARDALRPKCVVVAHSYCYFQPTGRKATGPFGLRQGRAVDAAGARRQGHRPRHRRPRAGALPGRRTACAAHGAGRGAAALQVVDMRTALPVDDVHWADEIHPSGTGFRRLAEDHWRPLLKAQFPGRGFD